MQFFKYAIFGFCTFLLTIPASKPALADGSDGFGQVFNMFFGHEEARRKNQGCEAGGDDQGGGIMGMVNSFFCHMEKDMGITGPGSATKSFDIMVVHAEVEGPASYVVGGVSYDYVAKVWVCNSQIGSCTSPTGFNRAISIAWSYASDKSVNKGNLVMDSSAFDGQTGNSGMSLVYDVGSATAAKTIAAKMVENHGGFSFRMQAEASKTADQVGAAMVMAFGDGQKMRFSGSFNKTSDRGGVYFEALSGFSGSGVGTLDPNAAGGTPGTPMCFARSRSATDWLYSPDAASCSVPAFPSDSANTVAGYTAAGVVGSWNAMAANPSSL